MDTIIVAAGSRLRLPVGTWVKDLNPGGFSTAYGEPIGFLEECTDVELLSPTTLKVHDDPIYCSCDPVLPAAPDKVELLNTGEAYVVRLLRDTRVKVGDSVVHIPAERSHEEPVPVEYSTMFNTLIGLLWTPRLYPRILAWLPVEGVGCTGPACSRLEMAEAAAAEPGKSFRTGNGGGQVSASTKSGESSGISIPLVIGGVAVAALVGWFVWRKK